MPTFARRVSTMSSVEFLQNSMVGQQRQQISGLHFDKFSNDQPFVVLKIRFKNQVATCSDFPSDAMLWIKEVEMVVEMLDAKIASALNKIIQNSQIKKKVSLEEQKSPERGPVSTRKTDRFHDLRQLSSDWRSWYTIGVCCFNLCHSSSWW